MPGAGGLEPSQCYHRRILNPLRLTDSATPAGGGAIITQSIPGSKQMPLRLEDFDYPHRTSSSRRRRPANAPPADCSKSAARLRRSRFLGFAGPAARGRPAGLQRHPCGYARCSAPNGPVARSEILIERPIGDHEALAQIRASKSPGPAAGSRGADGAFRGRGYRVGPESSSTSPSLPEKLIELLEAHGKPLPPYRTPRRAGRRGAR